MPPKKKRTKLKAPITPAQGSDLPHDTCPLLALPPELRNRIWQQVVHSSYEIDPTASFARVRYNINRNPHGVKAQPQPPITRVCRQIRSESLALYYSTNTFMFSADLNVPPHVSRQRAAEWIFRVGEDAKHFRSVRFSIMTCIDEIQSRGYIAFLISFNCAGDPTSADVKTDGVPYAELDSHCDRIQRGIVAYLRSADSPEPMVGLWRQLSLLARAGLNADTELDLSDGTLGTLMQDPNPHRQKKLLAETSGSKPSKKSSSTDAL